MGAAVGLHAVRPQRLTLPCFLQVLILCSQQSWAPAGTKQGFPAHLGPVLPLSLADTRPCQQVAVGDKDSAARGNPILCNPQGLLGCPLPLRAAQFLWV